MKTMLSTICAGLLLAGVAWADDGIVSTHRDAIQAAMGKHIQEMIEMNGNGKFPMFDPDTRTVVQLTFKEFHDSVEIRGREAPYFVSCSDFVAEDGTLYDIDFLVSGKYGVVTAIVHAKNGRHKSYEVH